MQERRCGFGHVVATPDFYIEASSQRNPMGAAALVLIDNELAIHGTNNPGSIGGLVSLQSASGSVSRL
jgi:lipoprotein-anchoring transpeptidase ErfK/SrfK